jgi:hypothetical protein
MFARAKLSDPEDKLIGRQNLALFRKRLADPSLGEAARECLLLEFDH